jgi:hypothetical protein
MFPVADFPENNPYTLRLVRIVEDRQPVAVRLALPKRVDDLAVRLPAVPFPQVVEGMSEPVKFLLRCGTAAAKGREAHRRARRHPARRGAAAGGPGAALPGLPRLPGTAPGDRPRQRLDLRIHTNGVRLSAEFCEVLPAERVLIGILSTAVLPATCSRPSTSAVDPRSRWTALATFDLVTAG